MFIKMDINKFGLYQGFRWPTDLPEMNRVNIIYGRNYSGKTTLSRIFDSVSQNKLHKNYNDGDFVLYTDDTLVRNVSPSNMSDCPYALRVYNADYVRRNLSWLNNEEEGEIRPFALIGIDNVEAQKEIDKINDELGSIEEKKGLLYEEKMKTDQYTSKSKKYVDDSTSFENLLKTKANSDIKLKHLYVKQGTNYNITSIKDDIRGIVKKTTVMPDDAQDGESESHHYILDASVKLPKEEQERLSAIVEEVQKPLLNALPIRELHLSEYEKKVEDLVTRRITLTKTIQELVEEELLQSWVDKGRELNRHRRTCAFCGSPISEERWAILDAHFSKESEELKQELTSIKEILRGKESNLEGFLENKGITKESIYVAYEKQFAIILEKWNEYVNGYKEAVGNLIVLIDKRLENLFKPVVYELESFPRLLTPIITDINELVEVNNAYGQKLETEKQIARDRLRLDYVYHFCEDIHFVERKERLEKDEKDVEAMQIEVDSISTKIKALKELRNQKEQDKKDEGKAAMKVTSLLVNHFGTGSLSLEPERVDEVDKDSGEKVPRTKFVVKRGDQYATSLSEGEKSLISFCYFIARMDDELNSPDAGKLVIFIDDPISSLDSSHIFFMYSLIDSVIAEPKNYGQLFISTHNLEFLRFLKRITLPGSFGKKEISHYVIEKLRKGDSNYKCIIKDMPRYLKDYVTEYNFLFEQIYKMAKPVGGDRTALINNTYTQYYNVANNMRKFLECYLFYKYPDTDKPLDHLNMLFDGHLPSAVNRVVNEYSHLSWAERGLRVVDVPEMEMAAKHILRALKEKDKSHFESLCNSVGVDEGLDLSISA